MKFTFVVYMSLVLVGLSTCGRDEDDVNNNNDNNGDNNNVELIASFDYIKDEVPIASSQTVMYIYDTNNEEISDWRYNNASHNMERLDKTIVHPKYTFLSDTEGIINDEIEDNISYCYIAICGVDSSQTCTDKFEAKGSAIKIKRTFKPKTSTNKDSTSYVEDRLKLRFATIPYFDPIVSTKECYPTLKFVKMSNTDNNQHPYATLWGYVTNDNNPKILISKDVADKLEYLCDWNKELAGNTDTSWWTMYMTHKGDILCVYNIGRNQKASNSQRRNPIVYPAGDYGNPIEVKLTGDRPTIWQRVGIDYIAEDDAITFAEYTRPNSPASLVWKIKGDITDPANWKVVKRFEVDPTSVGFKHCHFVQRDPFTGNIYLTTGDSDTAAAVYVSTDNAENYNLLYGPDEQTCRMSNIIYLKDYIYWATDSGIAHKHKVFRAQRNSHGVLDPNKIEILAPIPHNIGRNATYCTCYDEINNRLLFLDYLDGGNNYLDIYAYNLSTNKLETLEPRIYSVDGTSLCMGFRCSAVNFYQSKKEKRFVVGFQQVYPNNMALLGNMIGSDINRTCNMTIELVPDI